MKWNKENKERLFQVVWDKFQRIYSSSDNEWSAWHLRSRFFMEFGIIVLVHPRRRKGCVIIPNPWRCRHFKLPPRQGEADDGISLSIPKDIAEKFLILGVP